MTRKPWLLAALLLTSALAGATCNTVTVADTLYDENGNLLNGTVTVVNSSTITGADGCVVPAFTSKRVTVTNGALSVALVPNAGSTPSGTSYTVEYHVSSKYFTEYWTVPASGPQFLSGVRVLLPPTPSALLLRSQLPSVVAFTDVANVFTQNQTAPGFVGPLTGNAATATALAANGTNCAAGSPALGVDASGNGEGCAPINFNQLAGSASSGQVPLAATATALAANGTNCTGAKLPNGVDASGAAENCTFATPGQQIVDGVINANIQAAVTAASTTGSVLIPSNYAGTDVYTNPNGIQVIDLRGKPDRYRGFINMLTDCGLKGTGISSDDDAAAAQACFTAFPGRWFVFPQTQTGGACSYWFGSTVFPKGEGARISGAASGFKNSNTTMGGTVICSAAGVTPFWLDMTPNSSTGITIENLSLKGSEGTDHLTSPSKLNIPSGANLPQYTRNVAAAQRTAGVLSVTITAIGSEALTQQVGSQVKISGVSDATVNGKCIIATLTGANTFGENPTGFTCPQNGADTGALGAGGTISLPSEGPSTADGIRVCSNFNRIRNVSIDSFGRHGINADMQAGHGCTTLFSDDLVVQDSNMVGNQGDGFYCQGVDCNAGTMTINPIYYNLLWGVEDQSSLGNNWFGNQISNNGSQWATTATPGTKNISSISRTLTNGSSQTSVVLSLADTSVKLGSCVVIAGVTDTSFNTTAGQCFFVNSFTDSTHFGYEQPGAPANASSSGGTSRMAKFSEAYLSAGVDSGAVKVATQTLTYSQPWVGNYVEGGQDCKFGTSVIAFGGANMPTCVTSATWTPGVSFLGVSPGVGGSTTSVHGFANEKDQDNSVYFKAGKSGGTTRHTFFRWYNNNLSSDSWGLDVDPSGASGTTGTWRLSRNSPGTGPFRLSFFGATNASGITRLSSESTGAVQINLDNNSGTGGLTVCSGGASPTCPASSSIGSDFGHFAPYFKSSTTNPASAGQVRMAKTDAINFRNNANGADVNGISLDGSDVAQVGGTAGFKAGASGSAIADTRELIQRARSCGTTTACANTANGSNFMVFGSVALSSGTPSTATITGISPAFTSSATYFCQATEVTNAANNLLKVVNVSGSSFTITGPNTVTDTVNYNCVGN